MTTEKMKDMVLQSASLFPVNIKKYRGYMKFDREYGNYRISINLPKHAEVEPCKDGIKRFYGTAKTIEDAEKLIIQINQKFEMAPFNMMWVHRVGYLSKCKNFIMVHMRLGDSFIGVRVNPADYADDLIGSRQELSKPIIEMKVKERNGRVRSALLDIDDIELANDHIWEVRTNVKAAENDTVIEAGVFKKRTDVEIKKWINSQLVRNQRRDRYSDKHIHRYDYRKFEE